MTRDAYPDVEQAGSAPRSWQAKAPYVKAELTEQDPEYHETRGTLWEVRGTTP